MTDYIAKLRELRDKATPGPWDYDKEGEYIWGVKPDRSVEGPVCEMRGAGAKYPIDDNAEFITTMRNSLDLWLELAAYVEDHGNATSVEERQDCIDAMFGVLAKLKGN